MRNRIVFLHILAIVLVSAGVVCATDLRGRVDGLNPYTHTPGPLPGVSVGLFVRQPNGAFTIVRQAATGPDGMYYLPGVYPGQYVLQIGGVNYPLVVGATPTQDIPIIHR